MKTIKRKLLPAAKFMNRVEEIRASAGNIAGAANATAPAAAPIVAKVEDSPVLILDATRGRHACTHGRSPSQQNSVTMPKVIRSP